MKRFRLILSILCATSISGFSLALTCTEQQFSGNNASLRNPVLPSQLTLNKPVETYSNTTHPVCFITFNTVLPINEFEGIDLVKISGDLLSVKSPVTESGASTNPTIAAEGNASTAMVDSGKFSTDRPDKNQSPIIPIQQIASPQAFVIRVVK